jgi:hypothetical protein
MGVTPLAPEVGEECPSQDMNTCWRTYRKHDAKVRDLGVLNAVCNVDFH